MKFNWIEYDGRPLPPGSIVKCARVYSKQFAIWLLGDRVGLEHKAFRWTGDKFNSRETCSFDFENLRSDQKQWIHLTIHEPHFFEEWLSLCDVP